MVKSIYYGAMFWFYIILIQSIACTNSTASEVKPDLVSPTQVINTPAQSDLEVKLQQAGLVNIQKLEPKIMVDLKYSTTDNFMKMDMYGDLTHAYLQPDVSEKLANAYYILSKKYPDYTLLVYDAARPKSVQQMMWDSLDLPIEEKTKFISNPASGSLHNYGAAVDITICNLEGIPFDMGTPYDFIGDLAHPQYESKFLHEGKLTSLQIANRKILRNAMIQAGFQIIDTEWWHFNSCSREQAKLKYKIIE